MTTVDQRLEAAVTEFDLATAEVRAAKEAFDRHEDAQRLDPDYDWYVDPVFIWLGATLRAARERFVAAHHALTYAEIDKANAEGIPE